VHLARQVYPDNFASFHKTYLEVCKDPHTYLFLDLTQSVKDLLRFRTKIFPGEIAEIFAPLQVDDSIEVTTTLASRHKNAKPQARRALLAFADDDVIKAIVECAINTLNRSHKLSRDEKNTSCLSIRVGYAH